MQRSADDQASGARVALPTADGQELTGDLWLPPARPRSGIVVINPATAVKAAYYHRFARFLAGNGYAVLTYDYRGIGASRRRHPRATPTFDKFSWGAYDCDAALRWSQEAFPALPLHVVAHSIGGLLVGLAAHGRHVRRCLTVGAQYAFRPDYAAPRRLGMGLRWHLLMPLLTAIFGYFPARALSWHEDLPAAAAYEWARRPARLEDSYRHHWRHGGDPLRHFPNMGGDILAIGLADDPFGTPQALERLLAYFINAQRTRVEIDPGALGLGEIGHFGYFHERFAATLWADALAWLRDGVVPPGAAVRLPAGTGSQGGRHERHW